MRRARDLKQSRREEPYLISRISEVSKVESVAVHRRTHRAGQKSRADSTFSDLISFSTMTNYHNSMRYGRPGECSPEKDCLW